MTQADNPLDKALTWLVSMLVPVAIVIAGVRLIMTPAYLQIEYRTPNFPTDAYGFNLEDRLYWSKIALDILVKQEDVSVVQSLQFEDGTPVYNDRELRHWDDALTLWRRASRLGYGAWVILIVSGVWAWRGG